MHETGHIVACVILGTKPVINISYYGIKLMGYPYKSSEKLLVLISGPLVNLLVLIICYFNIKYRFSLKMYIFMCVNIIIFIFNILPIHFMDGGQIIGMLVENRQVIKILDFMSIITVVIVIFLFSKNYLHSIMAFGLFLFYRIL